jgi:hypothetical protein
VERRESRPDDLIQMAEMQREMKQREAAMARAAEELAYYKLELQNREENYNQIFSRNGAISGGAVGGAGAGGVSADVRGGANSNLRVGLINPLQNREGSRLAYAKPVRPATAVANSPKASPQHLQTQMQQAAQQVVGARAAGGPPPLAPFGGAPLPAVAAWTSDRSMPLAGFEKARAENESSSAPTRSASSASNSDEMNSSGAPSSRGPAPEGARVAVVRAASANGLVAGLASRPSTAQMGVKAVKPMTTSLWE